MSIGIGSQESAVRSQEFKTQNSTFKTFTIAVEAEKKGYRIDTKTVEKALGVTVVPTISTRKIGLKELITSAIAAVEKPFLHRPKHLNYGGDLEAAARIIEGHLRSALFTLPLHMEKERALPRLRQRDMPSEEEI